MGWWWLADKRSMFLVAIAVLYAALQLSGRPQVVKCDLQNGQATQISGRLKIARAERTCWSGNFKINEWLKKTFWASNFALKLKIFLRRPARYSQLLIRLATQEFLMHVRSSQTMQLCRMCSHQNMHIFCQYFYVRQPKFSVDHPAYQLGGPLGDPGIFVSGSTVYE